MSWISSCFGGKASDDREPLLPKYEDDTVLQRKLHQKLHTYQQLRALSNGYMPTTEQVIVNLRTLLASDVLNPDNIELSDSGDKLVQAARQWITQFIELLRNKNDKDQIQDLLWFLSQSRVSVDAGHIVRKAQRTRAKADTLAAYQSIRTVGSLLLTNEDFRTFVGDLNVLGREIFKESAFKLSDVAEEAGKKLEPSEQEQENLKQPGEDKQNGAPTGKELQGDAVQVAEVVAEGTADVAKTAVVTAKDKLEGDEGQTLLNRLKEVVLHLRKRTDYNESVSTITKLIQRYAYIYSRAAKQVGNAASEATQENEEFDKAMLNAYEFVTSFGEKKEWESVEEKFKQVMSHAESDPNFESMMAEVAISIQKMLTDPSFFDDAQEKIKELKEKNEKVGNESGLKKDVDALLRQVDRTFRSVVQDKDVNGLLKTTFRIFNLLSPAHQTANTDLLNDSLNVFLPLLISAIQYLPVLRLEISNPQIDLLLENLIVEPGHTVNQTSFLPYKLKLQSYNDITIRRTHTLRTATSHTHNLTITLSGLSARADDVGFWLRAHAGLLRLHDSGIASFALDERGLDLQLDIEIAKSRMDSMLSLKRVRTRIHHLNFSLRQSKFSWLGFIFKPLLRPILRKTLENQISKSLHEFFSAANRELLFARERLRATRISQPDDLLTFIKAVAARLTPEEDEDLYTRVGVVAPKTGVFRGVYAPGSLVKVWEEEGARAGQRVAEGEEEDDEGRGWKNEVFDCHTAGVLG